MVVKLGTLILEASVFQQSPRLFLLQLGLADRHQLEAGVRHHLADRAVPLLASVDIVLPGSGLEISRMAFQSYLQVKQGELSFIKQFLVLHFLVGKMLTFFNYMK